MGSDRCSLAFWKLVPLLTAGVGRRWREWWVRFCVRSTCLGDDGTRVAC